MAEVPDFGIFADIAGLVDVGGLVFEVGVHR
jgi:hypothetical protein